MKNESQSYSHSRLIKTHSNQNNQNKITQPKITPGLPINRQRFVTRSHLHDTGPSFSSWYNSSQNELSHQNTHANRKMRPMVHRKNLETRTCITISPHHRKVAGRSRRRRLGWIHRNRKLNHRIHHRHQSITLIVE